MSDENSLTFLGTLKNAISSWGNLIRSIIFVVSLFAAAVFSIYIIINHLSPTGFRITTEEGTSIEFVSSQENVRYYTLLVHPRGWIDSRIRVKEGDKLTITASGSINLALGGLIESFQKMSSIQDQNCEKLKIKCKSFKHFTPEEVEGIFISHPWTGPEGYANSLINDADIRKSAANKAEQRVEPNSQLGQLLTIISPTNSCPDNIIRPKDIKIYSYYKDDKSPFVVSSKGRLCFIVNDIIDPNTDINKLNWQDNLGIYSVNLKIESKR